MSPVRFQLRQEEIQRVSHDLESKLATTSMKESEAPYSRLIFPQISTLDVPKDLPQDVSQAFRLDVEIVSSVVTFLV